MSAKETIAILGGTGDLGTGLAIRWSKAGYNIVIGSRTQEKQTQPSLHWLKSALILQPKRWKMPLPPLPATSWCSPCLQIIRSLRSMGLKSLLRAKF